MRFILFASTWLNLLVFNDVTFLKKNGGGRETTTWELHIHFISVSWQTAFLHGVIAVWLSCGLHDFHHSLSLTCVHFCSQDLYATANDFNKTTKRATKTVLLVVIHSVKLMKIPPSKKKIKNHCFMCFCGCFFFQESLTDCYKPTEVCMFIAPSNISDQSRLSPHRRYWFAVRIAIYRTDLTLEALCPTFFICLG